MDKDTETTLETNIEIGTPSGERVWQGYADRFRRVGGGLSLYMADIQIISFR